MKMVTVLGACLVLAPSVLLAKPSVDHSGAAMKRNNFPIIWQQGWTDYIPDIHRVSEPDAVANHTDRYNPFMPYFSEHDTTEAVSAELVLTVTG